MATFGDFTSNKVPCPHQTISCQELLSTNDVSFSGMLLKPIKKCTRNSFICPLVEKLPWIHRYVLLYQGSLYHYPDSLSKKPSGTYTLYGFHQVVRAGDVPTKKYPWTFKIVNLANPGRCKYFAAGSEREMKEWMFEIRKQLIVANADLLKNVRVSPEPMNPDDAEKSIYGKDVQRVLSASCGPVHGENISSSELNSDSDSGDDYDKINENDMGRPLPPVPPEVLSKPQPYAPAVSPPQPSETMPSVQNTFPKQRDPVRQKPAATPPPVKPKPKPRVPIPGSEMPERSGFGQVPPKRTVKNTGLRFEDVYWDGTDKQTADQIIRNIGIEGVFMVRQSDNPNCAKTLLCYIGDRPVKFMIKQNIDNQQYYIQDGFAFLSILDLIEHYRHNNLPKKLTPLTEPYSTYTGR